MRSTRLSAMACGLLLNCVNCAPQRVPEPATPAAPTATQAQQPVAAATAEAPGKVAGIAADCAAWSTRVDGPYKYENNQWGSEKAKGGFEQCLLTRPHAERTQVGWTWSWPGFDPSVFAYPEIIFGWKPWSGGAPTDPRLPARVAEVSDLTLTYRVELNATGSYNLAPEIWLIKDKPTSLGPNPQLITTEVMFWMDYAEGARPAGSIVDEPTIGGQKYELWKEKSIGVQSNGVGWQLLTFKSLDVKHEATLHVHELLRHLVHAQLIAADEYVASVEFGNEVMGGTGTTWVHDFEVSLRL